ncbi:MAG: Calx-beta domain-containing protein [Chthoniobacterales bacterium]
MTARFPRLCLAILAPLLLLCGARAQAQNTVSLDQTAYTVGESAGQVSVIVRLARVNTNPVTVNYATNDGTATAGSDYTATNGTLTFGPTETVKLVQLPILDDLIQESTEQFTFMISNPGGGVIDPTRSTATITIQDNDGSGTVISFDADTYLVNENAGAVTVRVTRTGTGNATVNYATSPGSATAGADYQNTSGTIAFPNTSPDPGETVDTQLITIPIFDDSLVEGNESFAVNLTAATVPNQNYSFGRSTATVTIVDNETSTVNFSASSYSVTENGGNATITLLRSGNTNTAGRVVVSTVSGTATGDEDYASIRSLNVDFAQGQTFATFDIPIFDDTLVEGTESFYVTLSASPNSGVVVPGGTATAEVRIIDNESVNTVEFAGTDFSVNEQVGNALVTVRLNRGGDTSQIVTVQYFTTTGSATPGDDYTPVSPGSNSRLTFGPGETIKTFTIPIVNDTIPEDTETIGLVLANPTNATLGANATATLSILDNDAAGTVQFSSANYSVYENAGSVTLTVLLNRTGNTNTAVTVGYTTVAGSATTDRFVETSGTITFAPGSAVQTITVPIRNDAIIQPPQSFSVVLRNPSNAQLGIPSSATVTIQDDDGINSIQFASADYGTVETLGPGQPPAAITFVLTAQRGGDPNQTLTATMLVGQTGDTALAGTDYTSGSQVSITFPSGVSQVRVTVPVVNRPEAQGQTFFTARLTAPGQFTTIGQQASARATIFDNSGPNLVQLLTGNIRIREGTQPTISIPVFRTGAFNSAGTNVTYTTEIRSGDTARAGINFIQTSGTIQFRPINIPPSSVIVDNEHQAFISIPIPDNNLVEGDVTFHVTLTSSDVAEFGANSTVKVTILDDDLGNVVQLSSATYSVVENAGNAVLTVNLIQNGDASRPSSVNYAATPISAYAGFDFSAVSGTLIFGPNETSKTILIPINNDTISENPETFRVTLTDPSAGTIIGTPSNAIVTIVDDDVQSNIQFSPANYTISELGGSVTLNVFANRQGNPNNVLTVHYATFGGTASEGADYVGTSGTLTFGPGETQKTITVQILDDNLIESTENFFISLSNPGPGAGLGAASTATVDIADDDSPTASIGFSAASYNVDEGAGFANLTVTRSGGLGVSATVNYTTTDGTARAGVNYQQTSGSVTFNVGEVSKVIQVPIIDDPTADPTLSFSVTLTAPDGTGFIGGQSTATVNIIDNDATTFRFNPTDYTIDEGSGTVTLTVEALRVGDASEVISVDYATAAGTAAEGVKYQRTAGRLTFNAGVTTQQITVPIIDETAKEGTQYFFVNLSNPLGGTGSAAARIGAGRATVTILDNDATTFQFSSPTYVVNNSAGTATLTVTLSRLSTPNGTFTVDYTTLDGSAVAGRDYTPAAGTLVFGSGETLKTIAVALTPEPAGTEPRSFSVRLSNPSAGAELGNTSTATVLINNFDLSTKLRNVSTRGPVEGGQGVMIAGFIVEGDNKQVILRAIGPSLTQFGVAGAIQDPTLQLMDANGNQVAYNDDYTSLSSSDQQTLTQTGLTPGDPRESALVVVLDNGPHTAILRGKTDGVGLVEAYDFGATTTSRLVNISTRLKVKEGDNGALIAGFIVSAPNNNPGTAQEVVIRAMGPSLASYGVTGTLQNPTLDVYRGSVKVYSNDDWKTQSGAGVGSRASIEATGLQPGNDKEAALRLTLDPGSYSAVVRGKNSSTGISLVEVFQLR